MLCCRASQSRPALMLCRRLLTRRVPGSNPDRGLLEVSMMFSFFSAQVEVLCGKTLCFHAEVLCWEWWLHDTVVVITCFHIVECPSYLFIYIRILVYFFHIAISAFCLVRLCCLSSFYEGTSVLRSAPYGKRPLMCNQKGSTSSMCNHSVESNTSKDVYSMCSPIPH
jgi:hypothetical protein